MEQENQEVQEELGTGGKLKNWIQDNIRIIISVLIVIAIAGGIYSYSNRGEEAPISEEQVAIEESEDEAPSEEAEPMEDEAVIEPEEGQDPAEDETQQPQENEDAGDQVDEEDVKISEGEKSSESTSEETDDAFVETAVSGDSVTTLARKALKDHLEKNNDSSLTKEHKIYIEDYLQNNTEHHGALIVGEKISFSKQLIQNAIEKSKTLNEDQLENLKKYSSRVSNL